jgi:uncharacterized protein YegP (UPF0339 family)
VTAAKRRPKWIAKQTADGQWMVVLRAANGETLVWSESYTRKRDAERAWKAIIRASLEALMP